jgi:flavin-binding protein dodecin
MPSTRHRSRSQDTQERRGRLGQGQKIIVKNGKIAEYRVDLRVTFILID